jgi:type I restriction enzyme R subunit
MQNKEFCERVLDDETFGNTVKDLLVGYVYEWLRASS